MTFLESWAGSLLGDAVIALSRRLFGIDFDFVRAASTANLYGSGEAPHFEPAPAPAGC